MKEKKKALKPSAYPTGSIQQSNPVCETIASSQTCPLLVEAFPPQIFSSLGDKKRRGCERGSTDRASSGPLCAEDDFFFLSLSLHVLFLASLVNIMGETSISAQFGWLHACNTFIVGTVVGAPRRDNCILLL